MVQTFVFLERRVFDGFLQTKSDLLELKKFEIMIKSSNSIESCKETRQNTTARFLHFLHLIKSYEQIEETLNFS